MATFDDTQWLLSHVQNSYATSDDSGLSEVVLQDSWPLDRLLEFPYLAPDDSIVSAQDLDDPTPHSLDVHSDQSFIGHRFRSDTEHRLDKLRKEKHAQANITRILWQQSTQPLTESESVELFAPRPVTRPPATSLLSRLLDEDDRAQNPYLQWARWDGATDVNTGGTKRLSIYVYSGRECPSFPVRIVVAEGAKVLDVIGLTCFLYTRENLQPPQLHPPFSYSLRIADEDGSVDWEFTPLPHSERIDKFGFRVLAIAAEQQQDKQSWVEQPVTVTVHISGGVFSLIECESRDIKLREVLARTVAKRREMVKVVEAGVQYHLEKAEDDPGHELDLDRTLAEVNSVTLHAVRDNSKRAIVSVGGEARDKPCETTMVFPVTWVVKKWAKFEATIDVSRSGVLVEVIHGSSSGLLRPPHPVSYPSNRIVCCNLKSAVNQSFGAPNRKSLAPPSKDRGAAVDVGTRSTKKGGSDGGGGTKPTRCEILLTCQGESRFKDYLLECPETTGLEIVEAIKKIKTGDLGKRNKEEDKPRRRYSFAGLKKKTRTSYNQRGLPH